MVDRCFIGQINFSEVAAMLAAEGRPAPVGMPVHGLLRVDLVELRYYAARWYPKPAANRAVAPRTMDIVDTVSTQEVKINFRGSWSLRGLDWFDSVPTHDDELRRALNEFKVPGTDEVDNTVHKLFGHKDETLARHHAFVAVPTRGYDVREYEQVGESRQAPTESRCTRLSMAMTSAKEP